MAGSGNTGGKDTSVLVSGTGMHTVVVAVLVVVMVMSTFISVSG